MNNNRQTPKLAGLRILVVEDEPGFVDALEIGLPYLYGITCQLHEIAVVHYDDLAVHGFLDIDLYIFAGYAIPFVDERADVYGLGAMLYYALFAGRAQTVDAFKEAYDPRLALLRGRSPLVLVPVANPASAATMVRLANAIAMPVVGRVLLLTVVKRPSDFKAAEVETTKALHDATEVVEQAMSTSLTAGHKPEALMTLAFDPWREIARIARRCSLARSARRKAKH